MDNQYYSDRIKGPRPPVNDEITPELWAAIWVMIRNLINKGAFGVDFPEECPDNPTNIAGTDSGAMATMYRAEIPELPDPLNRDTVPETLAVLDFIEFCYGHVAEPTEGQYHGYFSHYHLSFDRYAGQTTFREQINRLFTRNALVYRLDEDGRIERLAPPILSEMLQKIIFDTGDDQLDKWLNDAPQKFLSPNPTVRRDGLKELWDAWERVKTLEGKKKQSIAKLLKIASPEIEFRKQLDVEACRLTDIGNAFLIRHSEMDQIPLEFEEHVDYLFHRMFALIYLLLKRRGAAQELNQDSDEEIPF